MRGRGSRRRRNGAQLCVTAANEKMRRLRIRAAEGRKELLAYDSLIRPANAQRRKHCVQTAEDSFVRSVQEKRVSSYKMQISFV